MHDPIQHDQLLISGPRSGQGHSDISDEEGMLEFEFSGFEVGQRRD
jgi:hypothetical protein